MFFLFPRLEHPAGWIHVQYMYVRATNLYYYYYVYTRTCVSPASKRLVL